MVNFYTSSWCADVDNDLKFAQYIFKITHIDQRRVVSIVKCYYTRDAAILIEPNVILGLPQYGLHNMSAA